MTTIYNIGQKCFRADSAADRADSAVSAPGACGLRRGRARFAQPCARPARTPRRVDMHRVRMARFSIGVVAVVLASVAAVQDPLAEPFRGVTTDGTVVPGLFPIRATGVTTEPVRIAAETFL